MNSITMINFLKSHYVDDLFHSHVSLIDPKGKFRFGRDNLEKFWDIYCNLIYTDKNAVVGIAEKVGNHLPILADFDIKIRFTDDIDVSIEHLYTEENIRDVIGIYQSVLRTVVEGCTDENLICVLLEKPIYSIKRSEHGEDITFFKGGFHAHWPNVFLKKTDIDMHVTPRIKALLKERRVFENLDIADSSELMDASITTVPWLLYGGRKSPEMKPYLVTKIFDANIDEISMEEAFKYYQIYDTNETLINMKGNYMKYLPRILSIIPHHRQINEIKHGLISPLKEQAIQQNAKNGKKNENKTIKASVEEDLKTAKKLLPMLSQTRVEGRNEWLEVGWVLFNIGEGCDEALQLWIEFSERTEEDKFDEDVCISEWSKMVKKDYSIGTLKYYASIDSPEEYMKFKFDEGQNFVKDSISCSSHYDIAKLLHTEYCTEFVCPSIANKTWFKYTGHRWEEIEEGHFLRTNISTEIVEKFSTYGGILFQKRSVCDKTEEKLFQDQIKATQKMIQNLKSTPYKINIMKEAADIFYDKNFYKKLDINPYLIGFINGVYDLKKNEFRVGKPEDYISKCMPINFTDFTETDNKVFQVHDFLEKVFPDKEVRQYFMDQASDVFVGGNHQKVVLFWTGDGDNGKSVTQNIFEQMLGPYAIKFSTTLLTGKKVANGQANPELARAGGGVRWAVLEEPDGDEEINIGYLKTLSCDDSYFVRDLFEKGKQTKEIKPLFKLSFICLAGDTKVSLSSGVSVSIDKMINNKQKILSWDSEKDGLININQNAFLDKGIQECITLTLLDGRQITCTPNHRFLTSENRWIEAQDIKIGFTKLKMGVDYPTCDDLFNEYEYELNAGDFNFNMRNFDDRIKISAFVRLLGYVLTDGSKNKSLYIGHQIDCENIINDIFLLTGKKPSVFRNNQVFQTNLPANLVRAFSVLCPIEKGKRVDNETVFPGFLFDKNCPDFVVVEFIAGIFGGDGILPSLVKNTFNNIQLVGSKSTNFLQSFVKLYEKLAGVLKDRFDIESHIHTIKYKDEEKYYVFLNINKYDSMLNFCEKIGFRHCCHKSYRITAVASYLRYKKSIIEQNTMIIDRTRELYDTFCKQNPSSFIMQVNKNSNDDIKIFKSTQKAQHETGINHSLIRSACLRSGTAGVFKWKFVEREKEILEEDGAKSLKDAYEQSVEEITNNYGIINRKYITTYTQVTRYIRKNIDYKMPSIDIKEFLEETNMFQFCNQGKGKKGGHHYSVKFDNSFLPCFEMRVINSKNIGEKQVYDLNVDEPYSNFIASGIVTHNCNKLPRLRHADKATFNRIKVIPFESTFVRPGEPCPETYEEQLREKRFPMDREFGRKIPDLLEAFAWVLLQHRKKIRVRVEPEKVRMATALYQKQNDRYRQFVEEKIMKSPDSFIELNELNKEFKDWYKEAFPGYGSAIPDKNEIREYFIKLWGDLDKGIRWKGYRIKEMRDFVDNGEGVEVEVDLDKYEMVNEQEETVKDESEENLGHFQKETINEDEEDEEDDEEDENDWKEEVVMEFDQNTYHDK